MNIKKLSVNLDLETQWRELELLMQEDGQKNITAYIVYLIYQEKKRRAGAITEPKRSVGRPKKSEDVKGGLNLYPAPYKGGAPYSKEDLENYYDFNKKEAPPLPPPLTAEQIKEYNE